MATFDDTSAGTMDQEEATPMHPASMDAATAALLEDVLTVVSGAAAVIEQRRAVSCTTGADGSLDLVEGLAVAALHGIGERVGIALTV